MHVSDRISGAAVTFLGLLTIVGAIQLPPMPGQDVGPSAFPIVIGIGLGISGLLIALGIGHRFEEEAQADLAAIESETMLAGAEATRGAPGALGSRRLCCSSMSRWWGRPVSCRPPPCSF